MRCVGGLIWAAGFALPGLASAAEISPTGEAVEEMVVYGEVRPALDILAGTTISRIQTDERLLEGARIDDLLAETPGVQVRRFGGAGERFEISIRGSRPEQVPVFLDGFRLDTSLTGRSDLSSLCLDILDEIQVVRGAGAARSGSGAIGGVVNLVSRKPEAQPETRLRGSVGSFESYEGSLRHTRRIGETGVALGYCGFRTEGDFEFQQIGSETNGQQTRDSPILRRINNEAERHTGLVQMDHPLAGGEVRLTQLITDLDRGAPGLAFADTQRLRSREENFSSLTALAFERPFTSLPSGRFDLRASHRFERNDFRDPDAQVGSPPIRSRTEVSASVLTASVQTQFGLLAGQHRVSLLAEGRLDSRGSNEANRVSRSAGSLRAELESSWWGDRLLLSPSIRMEKVDGFDLEWLPSLAVQAELTDFILLRGSVSRSFRAPSFQELFLPDKGFEVGNPNLEPEEAFNFEVGAILSSPFENPLLDFELEGTFFGGEIDRGIVFQIISTTRRSFVNIPRAETRGYELALRWEPHDWVRMTASRTVTQSELETNGAPIPGIAASQTDGRIELGPRDTLKLVGEIHYTGRIFLRQSRSPLLPSRTRYDASASLNLAELPLPGLDKALTSLWFSVRGRNLGNIAIYDTGSFPQPGRNWSFALEGVF